MSFWQNGFGEMSLQRNVYSVKYPFGETFVWQNILSVKCPFGKTSVWGNILLVKRLRRSGFGEMGFGETYHNPFRLCDEWITFAYSMFLVYLFQKATHLNL